MLSRTLFSNLNAASGRWAVVAILGFGLGSAACGQGMEQSAAESVDKLEQQGEPEQEAELVEEPEPDVEADDQAGRPGTGRHRVSALVNCSGRFCREIAGAAEIVNTDGVLKRIC